MGWVVSKSVKEDLIEKIHKPEISNVVNSLENIETEDNITTHDNGSPLEEEVPTSNCDILIIDHDIEYRNSTHFLRSAMTNEESIGSLQHEELSEPIEISEVITQHRSENIVQKSSNDVKICPRIKNKISNRSKGHTKVERKLICCPKNKNIKQLEPLKRDTNRVSWAKKTTVMKAELNVVIERETQVENSLASCKAVKPSDFMRCPHKKLKIVSNAKICNAKIVTQKFPQVNVNANKMVNKLPFPKSNTKTNVNKNNRIINIRAKTCVNEGAVLSGAKDDLISLLQERNYSPNAVNDVEKRLQMDDCDLEQGETKSYISHKEFLDDLGKKKRPVSAYLISTNKKENFDNIIQDFNRKLEKIINDNHMMSCLCNNCNTKESGVENKTTAGKITFFFLKKYGNVGKFILARLNEFLDNVYDVKTNENEVSNKTLDNDFPLPCNINDIEYDGALKSYSALIKEGIVVKPKNSKTKLPKLIPTKMRNSVKEKNSEMSSPERSLIPKEKNKNKKESGNSKKKLNFKDLNMKEIKTDVEIDKLTEVNYISLPPLKPASSITNLCKSSNSVKSKNIIFQTMNFSSDQIPFAKLGYGDIFSTLYHENPFFSNDIVQSCIHDSDRTSNDFYRNTFENSLKSIDQNEEDITILANKMIDDLWKNTFVLGCEDNSISRH